MKSTSVIALIAAAGAGFIIGLLVAPDKGTETRRKLASGAKDLKDKISGNYETLEHINQQEEYDAILGI